MIDSELERRLSSLKRASRELARLSSAEKNGILRDVADRLEKKSDEILAANRVDLARATTATPAFIDRLTLDSKRIEHMAEAVRAVARLEDPVGEIIERRELANGLRIRRARSPLGTILMIFESRPNVITEVFSLAFKSGNAIALRGGSDSRETAAALYRVIDDAMKNAFGENTVEHRARPFVGIQDYDRALVGRLLRRVDIFDICIPRGGSELIERVTNESKMPIIKNDKGVCHLYVHEKADRPMATRIAINAKTQRPGVCNSIETVLVDRAVARDVYREMIPTLFQLGVRFFACDDSFQLLQEIAKTDRIESRWVESLGRAEEADFHKEYLDLKLNLKIVEGFELALFHIGKFGSNHSETIVTDDEETARRFQNEIDSACVYWNASTRFTDGFELGLGGEIGISTQKLHVRGPVGLRELTSVRWLIDGNGHVRT